MKEWLKAQGISYRKLASSMGSSAATVCKKLNGETPWQQRDLLYIAGACVILGVIDVLVWKKGMKAYQSTGA